MGANNCASQGPQACAQGGSQQSPRTPKAEEDDVSRLTMWEHDVEAMKEEAAKRQERREQEAAARQERIEAAEAAAEDGRRGREAGGSAKPEKAAKSEKAEKTGKPSQDAKPKEAPASKNGTPVKSGTVEMTKAEEQTKEPAQLASAPDAIDKSQPLTEAAVSNVQKEIDEVQKGAADQSLVRYLLEVKIVSAKNVPANDKQQFVVGLARCDNAVKFRTKTATTKEKAVWNQASKLQIAQNDFLTFRVQDKDSEDPMSYIARARLEFDRMLPAGFEDELPLEDASGNKVAGAVIKVRIRVQGARVTTGQDT